MVSIIPSTIICDKLRTEDICQGRYDRDLCQKVEPTLI
jgi:hypothetical protein